MARSSSSPGSAAWALRACAPSRQGRQLVIADFNEEKLGAEVERPTRDGFDCRRQRVDVSDRASVGGSGDGRPWNAAHARAHRRLVAHAGERRARAEVDMLGTDHVLAAFLDLVTDGSVAVCIASMAGYMADLSPRAEHALAVVADRRADGHARDVDVDDFGVHVRIAKRIDQLRVERPRSRGATGRTGREHQPGIISTPMGRQELEEGSSEQMQGMLDLPPVPRIGTAEDIAAAVDWLASPAASFVSGCDLRVDGGVTGAIYGSSMPAGRASWRSLPLDRRRRLARDVEHDPVDVGDLVGDAGGDAFEHLGGSRAQSAVIAASLAIGRNTIGWA